jgi:hypothetical protein
MPFMAIYSADVSPEDYARYRAQVPIAPVKGGLIHHYGRAADGTLRIVDVWDNLEDMEAFARDTILPALEALGIPTPGAEIVELETLAVVGPVERYLVGQPAKVAEPA